MLTFRRKKQLSTDASDGDMSVVTKDKSTKSLSQSTIISAPATVVWESLTDIKTWQWNRSLRLDASYVMEGETGKSRIVLGGRRATAPFKFGKVSRRTFTFTWTTKLGCCESTNTVELKPIGINKTELVHTQTFEGKLLFLRPSSKKYQKAVRVMDEGLKNHVESLYFNTLLYDFSNSEMVTPGCSTSTEMTVLSEMSGTNFWDTPKHIREKLVNCFVDKDTEAREPTIYDA
ncbi:unnamed protein product [Cylindrotheca closterium]|uniref:Uncharacterized protein n=1 Tax=Cylindrotheca closterium TaxID=2856 RepID=A0AAD2G0G2_9STRA|nr:unnamed protein product [Cylindrotheca closterium]